jgi:hypothetical protein
MMKLVGGTSLMRSQRLRAISASTRASPSYWTWPAGVCTPTAYNNANARVGVGDSTAAEAATQTALQGASTAFKGMDTGYPSRSAQTVSFRGTFGGSEANFAWEEFTVDNGATPNKNLVRKVSAQGTKTSGQTWELTIQVTMS